jgi:hypothetical protein
MLPFKQKKVSSDKVIRTFSQDTPSEEFKWHRDAEDRIIKPLQETDWKIQIDNQLPVAIKGIMEIPAGVYHRVIKGTGNLHLEIEMNPKEV